MKFNKFLNTIVGSWIKVFLSAVLTFFLNNIIIEQDNFFTINWQQLIIAGLVPTLPIVINYLNKQDPRYGNESKKETEIVEKEPEKP